MIFFISLDLWTESLHYVEVGNIDHALHALVEIHVFNIYFKNKKTM